MGLGKQAKTLDSQIAAAASAAMDGRSPLLGSSSERCYVDRPG
jgi:hypothetical protein